MKNEDSIGKLATRLNKQILEIAKISNLNDDAVGLITNAVERTIANIRFAKEVNLKLSEEDIVKLENWIKEQEKKAVEKQRQFFDSNDPMWKIAKTCWDEGYPYTGAIGGDISTSETFTSLGCIRKYTYNFTSETLDLTKYEDW
mgnify:CR=1 FL=1